MSPNLAVIARLLHYSFQEAFYSYSHLTDAERALLTEDEFNELVTWLKGYADRDTVAPVDRGDA